VKVSNVVPASFGGATVTLVAALASEAPGARLATPVFESSSSRLAHSRWLRD